VAWVKVAVSVSSDFCKIVDLDLSGTLVVWSGWVVKRHQDLWSEPRPYQNTLSFNLLACFPQQWVHYRAGGDRFVSSDIVQRMSAGENWQPIDGTHLLCALQNCAGDNGKLAPLGFTANDRRALDSSLPARCSQWVATSLSRGGGEPVIS
jgi:hypothetical protein